MNTDKTSHTPFDDMLAPKLGLPRPWRRFRLRRFISPVSTYGLTFALGATCVFLGSMAVRSKLPAPVLPTPMPTPMVRISLQPAPATAVQVHPLPSQPREILAAVSRPAATPAPAPRETPQAPAVLAAASAVPKVTRRVRRLRKSPVPNIREILATPRRIEATVLPLPQIRIPRSAPPVRQNEEKEEAESRYYPEFDPVRQAQDRRQSAFEDEEFDEQPPPEDEWNDARNAPGPVDGEFSEDEADEYPGHRWGRAGGREKKWRREKRRGRD